ncbi:efflux RND transporter periplasmic adaptor subunit [Algoriphagus sp. Y33]|uniref:efflux RND transporter periplasmic adaptor subunit n=1 Tax=Algoriphagus sp. Y33 TaxID=2772483 RepID=UPI00177F9D8A|nr:efflux RND transporter periplasmic adaptor subunit [Algoriphagus sp. Y33]
MKKLIVPIGISAAVILSIILALSANKKKIDQKNQPVDRSNIPVSVGVAKVEKGSLDAIVQYPALVEPMEEAGVYSHASGIISQLDIFLGKQVHKGEIMGKLDTRIQQINLKSAEANLNSTSISRDKALRDYQRAKDLYEHNARLEMDMLSAKSNYESSLVNFENAQAQIDLIKQQIANSAIVSPVTGTVSKHKIKEGEFVITGTAIANISNISRVKATVYVNQQTSYQLKANQEATITTPVFSGKTFTGHIVFSSPVADDNHNYQVDLLIENSSDIALKGGTDVLVSFITLSRSDILRIPQSALVTGSSNPTVFVAENERAIERPVTTGHRQNDMVEIISGLREGETVITSGLINVKSGSPIAIITI